MAQVTITKVTCDRCHQEVPEQEPRERITITEYPTGKATGKIIFDKDICKACAIDISDVIQTPLKSS